MARKKTKNRSRRPWTIQWTHTQVGLWRTRFPSKTEARKAMRKAVRTAGRLNKTTMLRVVKAK